MGARLAWIGLLLSLSPGCASGLEQPRPVEVLQPLRPAGVEALRETLRGFDERPAYLGSVALVQRAGQVVLHEAFNEGDLDSDHLYGPETIFPIASMTKPIVSVAAMQLVEEGRLDLEDPVERYLPAFADPVVARFDEDGLLIGTRPAARSITIADLLAHTSGLCYAGYEEGSMKALYEGAGLDRDFESSRELAEAIAGLPLAFDPGTEWRYGRSIDVLGAVLEELCGASLEALLRERVFEPLGMLDTSFHVPEDRRDRLCASRRRPRVLDSNSPAWIPVPAFALRSEPAVCNAGGGLFSTAEDYLRFCEMLLGEGTRDGVRLLSPESVRLMTTERIAGLPRPRFFGDRGFGLGFAVLTEESAGPLNGSVGSFHWSGIHGTSFFVDPEHDLIGVFLVHQRRDFSYMVAFRKAVYAALPGYEPEPAPASGNEVGE